MRKKVDSLKRCDHCGTLVGEIKARYHVSNGGHDGFCGGPLCLPCWGELLFRYWESSPEDYRWLTDF